MKKKPSPTGATAYARMPAKRMSTKHQSIGDQIKAIRKFAKRQGLIIVKVYSDGGSRTEPSKSAKEQK